MDEQNIYPYNDEEMIFDESSRRYVLTEHGLMQHGTDLRNRLIANKAIAPENVINRLLKHTSNMIYNYIHSHNNYNAYQDELIAKTPSLRPIIKEALLCQAEYILLNGDLSRSVDKNNREVAIDQNAKCVLEQTVSELGIPIIYIGG